MFPHFSEQSAFTNPLSSNKNKNGIKLDSGLVYPCCGGRKCFSCYRMHIIGIFCTEIIDQQPVQPLFPIPYLTVKILSDRMKSFFRTEHCQKSIFAFSRRINVIGFFQIQHQAGKIRMIPVTGSTVPGNPACNINGFSHLVEDNIFQIFIISEDNADISHGREYFTSGITRKQVIPRMILFHHGFSPPSECRMSDRAEFGTGRYTSV